MTPYLQDPDFTLYLGDVREILPQLPAGSVDCVVTSPPYWGLRDYSTGTWDGGNPDCDHKQRANHGHAGDVGERNADGNAFRNSSRYVNQGEMATSTCGRCGARRVDQQIGLEPTPEQFVTQMVEVFREVRRVLAPHGTLWLNLGDSYGGGALGRNDAGRNFTGGGGNREGSGNPGRQGVADITTGLKPKDLVGIPWRVAFALQQPYYAGRIKDERDRIWLAAVIEAEGCMFIHKRKVGQSNGQGYVRKNDGYGAGLEVSSTDRVIVERCIAITGTGSICEQSPEQNGRRKQTLYRWNVRSNECRWIIRELYPHLLAKKHEARLLLGCPSSGDDARKAWASLKALHQGQSADIDFREPEGMWEEGWFLRSDIIWAKLDRTRCPNP